MNVDEKERVARKLIDCVTGYSADEACFFLVLAIDGVVTSCTDNEQSYQRSMDMIIAYMTNAKKAGRVIKPETMQ
jgi:hypothetical protein